LDFPLRKKIYREEKKIYREEKKIYREIFFQKIFLEDIDFFRRGIFSRDDNLVKEMIVDGIKVDFIQSEENVEIMIAGINFRQLLKEDRDFKKQKKKEKKDSNKENARKFFEVNEAQIGPFGNAPVLAKDTEKQPVMKTPFDD